MKFNMTPNMLLKRLELQDFKNIYRNEDIYVIGSGKSLDFISNDFFDNKITIGVNQTYKKFIPTFLIRKESQLLEAVIAETDLKNNPDLVLFVSRHCGGAPQLHGRKNRNFNMITKRFYDMSNIVIYNTINNIAYGRIADKHVDNDSNRLLATTSTIHTAIHLACYMGAKNIILCGHDCVGMGTEINFDGYHTAGSYRTKHKHGKSGYRHWVKKVEPLTQSLQEVLKTKYDVNIVSINPFISLKSLKDIVCGE